MEKILVIDDQTITFVFSDNPPHWQATAKAGGTDLRIHIDINLKFHRDTEVDWNHFTEFFRFINKPSFVQERVEDSEKLIDEMGRTFFNQCQDEIEDWKMVFSNEIFYNGRTDGSYINDGYSFSLAFEFYTLKDGGSDGDAYGVYLVDVENWIITGARRHQG